MTVALMPLAEALQPYRGVSVRTARGWIRAGKLPATKVGRAYLVSPDDVAALLAPKLRQPKPQRGRESETARIARQLRGAGVLA